MKLRKYILMIVFSWLVFSYSINATRIWPDPPANSPTNGLSLLKGHHFPSLLPIGPAFTDSPINRPSSAESPTEGRRLAQSHASRHSSPVKPLKPVLPTGPPAKSMNQAVQDVCKITENPLQCASFVAPFIKGSTDPVSVLNMEIMALYKQLEQAISGGQKLIKSSHGGIKKATSNSLNIYTKVIDDLGKALFACSSHDITTAKGLLASTISKFGEAEEEFNNVLRHNEVSPLKQYNDLMTEMANYSFEICLKIEKGHIN